MLRCGPLAYESELRVAVSRGRTLSRAKIKRKVSPGFAQTKASPKNGKKKRGTSLLLLLLFLRLVHFRVLGVVLPKFR